jgi:hypothetical protein
MRYDGPAGMMLDLVGPSPNGADLEWMHPYAYAHNNPLRYFDPTGLQAAQGDAAKNCKTKGWRPLKPKDCNYGRKVGFEADFVMYDRDRDKCSQDCDPHVMQRSGGSGACTARVNWPLDCVCKNMPDNDVSNCVRGCLRCLFDEKKSAADLEEHTWCIDQCAGVFSRFKLYQQLDVAIHCCAKKQGTVVGPGTGKKPAPAGPPKVPGKIDCNQCGGGPTRPIDCSGY